MRAAATGGVIGGFALLVLGTMPAAAQTCAGVEWRVNAQTIALQGVVSGQIEAAQAAMLALDQTNRARLLSALKVMTKQESASTDQTVLMEQKAGEAAASAITTSTRNQEIAAAQNRYRATGYGACAVGTKASSFYAAVKAAPQARAQILQTVSWKPGAYGSQSAWASGVGASGPFDANSLFAGDTTKAAQYISFVMGPPDLEEKTAGAGSDARKVDKAGRDALKSTAAYVMASIASDYATGGPVEKLRAMNAHWLASDGGEAWSAKMADQPERGVLQDAIRVEAANLVTLAFNLKSGVRQEAVTAAYLLARIKAAMGPAIVEPAVAPAAGGAR